MELFDIPHTHYLCTAAESQSLDRATIEDFGISGYTLMEVAGSKTAQHLLEKHGAGDRGLFLCGKGNNGGDALVVARYLIQNDIHVTLVFISGVDELSDDADKNFRLLQQMQQHAPHDKQLKTVTSWAPESLDPPYDFIVDGMLGTGLDSELRGDYQSAVAWTHNQQKTPKYSIDIPTGLHADTGQIMGDAIHVDETYTFGAVKQGFYLNEGPQVTGTVTYCDLPFPNYLKKDFSSVLLDESWVEQGHLLNRSLARHKYEAGVLYIVAGSDGLTGAAVMAARSAWGAGIGAVILVCPRGLLPVFETKLTQVITRPVGEEKDYYLKDDHLDQILEIIRDKPGKVVYGPGIGRQPETVDLTHQLIQQYEGDILIDADGLWALSQRSWESAERQNLILTPHPGELGRLLDEDIKDDADRLQHVRNYSNNKKVTLLSKGYPVQVAIPDGLTYITGYETRIFSRAGFGDVLAGKIGAYWTLTGDPERSCILGMIDGKKKADTFASRQKKKSSHSLEPLDLI